MRTALIFRIARFYSLEFLTYPLETFFLLIRRIAVVGLLLFFWSLVAHDNNIEGLKIVPYILLATGTQFLAVGQNFRQAHDISDDIRHGALNNLLIRPVNELVYEFSVYLGKNSFELSFSILNIVVGLLLVDSLTTAQLLLFLVALVPCILIGYALNIVMASATFWATDTTHLRLTVYFLLRIVSGMWLPLTFIGGWLGTALQYLPFAQAAFVPSYIITGDNLHRAAMLVLIGFVQAPLAVKGAWWLWRKGLKKYGAIGI